VGKTRLATEASGRLGVAAWFVPLAPVTDPADVASAVLDTLGIREPVIARRASGPGAGPLDRLAAALGDRDEVMVLDNCEHVIEAAAALVGRVLAACPRMRILATSRQLLRIDGETSAPCPRCPSRPRPRPDPPPRPGGGRVENPADTAGSGTRYRMLETVRAYGLERLAEAGEEAAMRAAFAAYHLNLAEVADPRSSVAAFQFAAVVLFVLRAASGEREEDLVQARLAEREFRELNAPVIELAEDVRQQGRVAHGRGRHAGLGVGCHLSPDQSRHQRGDLGHPGRVGGRDLQHLAPGLGLQLVRRRGRDDLAVVDDHDVVRELLAARSSLRRMPPE
jgi:predicted ATPase